VKDELAHVKRAKICCKTAELSALIKVEGILHLGGKGGLALHTESENASVARLIITLTKELFGVSPNLSIERLPRLRNHNCYYLHIRAEDGAEQILRRLGILDKQGRPRAGIPRELLERRCCKKAYLRGAFLGSGFVGNLRRNRHLEFNLAGEEMAENLRRLLEDLGIGAGIALRRSIYVVYIKKKESIIDLLGLLGAHSAVLDMENLLIISSIKERVNRQVNCETANLEKVARAARKQLRDIQLIEEHLGLKSLSPSLQEIATMRLRYPDLSIDELGKRVSPPLSKSATYHRLTRIASLASHLERENSAR
jgi:hypothetical protein